MANRGTEGGGGPKRPRSSSPDRDAFGRSRDLPPPRRRDDHRRDGNSYRQDHRGGGGRGPPDQQHHHHYRGGGGRDNYPPPPPPEHTYRGSGGGGGGRDHNHRNDRPPPPPPRARTRGTTFSSLEEERAWLAQRRRNRLSRPSLFDVPPTPEQAIQDAQAATLTNFAATDFSGAQVSMPQQTRHARRLYVGNLPPGMGEDELHRLFREAIDEAAGAPLPEDPILSVYINQERRFCFLEFKTVEMTTACMALDGIDLALKGKVKIKRPNDYNPAMAPEVHPSALPKLDVSRLGIISGTVPDGPNKIFVGGLHYHLLESQILELLGAFGKVKAFHLVKSDPDSETSKGYCFVEYLDSSLTHVAVTGLNGFDLGGGKVLTARIANAKDNEMVPAPQVSGTNLPLGVYNVEELVDAAMGLRPMPTAPSLMGMAAIPLTPSTPSLPIVTLPPMPAPVIMSALEISNLLEAATSSSKTRVLVLLNMVTDEDLATDQNHRDLSDEVHDECSKYGTLLSMKIPLPRVRILTCSQPAACMHYLHSHLLRFCCF
jgi:splicing factor U2AF 65 kDa subunit